jgi:short-subunit dehydrogenase
MPSDFAARYGPWALVTGASSGIGREFARQLAARGLNVVLVARREDRLRALAAELEGRGVQARVAAIDLCYDGFLEQVQAATDGLEIGLLVNNAGFSMTGPLLESDPDDMLRLLNLNCRAPLVLTRDYGPAMQDRGHGGIIFVASVAGFSGIPLWSHYAASKAYDLLLAEGLAAELRGAGIDVLALAPGTTRTEFLDVAELNRDLMAMEVEDVVREAVDGLGRRDVVVPGLVYKAGTFAMRFLPRSFNRYVFGRFIATMHEG